jgi:tRNA 2-thiocytidine biosynthesis protein TtcA
MTDMLADIERRMPRQQDIMIRAMANVSPSHRLDVGLVDFSALIRTQADDD